MPLSNFLLEAIGQKISLAINKPFNIDHHRAISGGDINQSFYISDSRINQSYFVKANHANRLAMFESEVLGLNAIIETEVITTPQVITSGVIEEISFLALSYLPLSSSGNEFLLGQQLAKMHRATQASFGFTKHNFIGTTPQNDTHKDGWLTFWRDCRLLPQLELAYRNGYQNSLEKSADKLLECLPEYLGEHSPAASLVHGDFWGGNKGFLQNGTPVIFDPACYYGDRETDIAMTQLFGGFGRDFYQGYNAEWPLAPDYKTREPLYNLYHQLNHLNLFGSAYLESCVNSINVYL